MAYKSKDKFLEVGGKRWSFCHVDPALGIPCSKHSNHVYAMGSTQQFYTDPYLLKYFENLENKKSDLQDYWGEDINYTQVQGKPFGITDRKMILDNGVELTQIVATEDIYTKEYTEYADGIIHRGELGGFIEKPEGLIDGWVGHNAFVFGNSIIDGGAYVYDSTVRSSDVKASGSIIYSSVIGSKLTGDIDLNMCDVTETTMENLKADNSIIHHNEVKPLGMDSETDV